MLEPMLKAFEFRLPAKSTTVPHWPRPAPRDQIQRLPLRVERAGDRVRLITRGSNAQTSLFRVLNKPRPIAYRGDAALCRRSYIPAVSNIAVSDLALKCLWFGGDI